MSTLVLHSSKSLTGDGEYISKGSLMQLAVGSSPYGPPHNVA